MRRPSSLRPFARLSMHARAADRLLPIKLSRIEDPVRRCLSTLHTTQASFMGAATRAEDNLTRVKSAAPRSTNSAPSASRPGTTHVAPRASYSAHLTASPRGATGGGEAAAVAVAAEVVVVVEEESTAAEAVVEEARAEESPRLALRRRQAVARLREALSRPRPILLRFSCVRASNLRSMR